MHGDTEGILDILCTLNPVGHFGAKKKSLKGWTLQEGVFLQLNCVLFSQEIGKYGGLYCKTPLMEDDL